MLDLTKAIRLGSSNIFSLNIDGFYIRYETRSERDGVKYLDSASHDDKLNRWIFNYTVDFLGVDIESGCGGNKLSVFQRILNQKARRHIEERYRKLLKYEHS